MRTGEPVTAAPGRTSNKVLDMQARLVAPGVVRLNWLPWGPYRNRNYALFVNGIWRGNYFSDMIQESEATEPVNEGTTSASLQLVESGDHETFDETEYVPSGWVEEAEADDASRLQICWTSGYSTSCTSTQFSSWTVTGLSRFFNCEQVGTWGTRGRLWIELVTITGTTRVLRLWANNRLVAESQRTGDGIFTLAAANNSGLDGSVVIVYAGDIARGTDSVDFRWPAAYNVHYSTSGLSYPRTPEAIVHDRLLDNFVYLSPVLASGTWAYSVQPVGDDAIERIPVTTPSDSPKAIGSAPLPATITGATGNAATGITVSWTPGEGGCQFWFHSGKKNEPVNLGDYADPVPFLTGYGATSATFTVADWSPVDRTAAWAAMQASMQSCVDAVNAAYDSGATGFTTVVLAQKTLALDAIRTLGRAIDCAVNQALESAGTQFDMLYHSANGLAFATDDDWRTATWGPMSGFLDGLSGLMFGEMGQYTFTGGQLPYAADPTGDATGSSEDGSADDVNSSGQVSLLDLVTPLTANSVVWVIVRALKGGYVETTDDAWPIEIDGVTGDVIQPRPNQSWIDSVSSDGLVVTAVINVRTDDQEVAADKADFYAVAWPGPIDYTSYQATGDLSDRGDGILTATISWTAAAVGHYVISSRARVSTTGSRSLSSVEQVILVANEVPADASDVHAKVIRGAPVEEQEGAG